MKSDGLQNDTATRSGRIFPPVETATSCMAMRSIYLTHKAAPACWQLPPIQKRLWRKTCGICFLPEDFSGSVTDINCNGMVLLAGALGRVYSGGCRHG